MPDDNEELALTLNGRKRKIKRNDFEEAMNRFDLSVRSKENIFKKFEPVLPSWLEMISLSFLSDEMKHKYTSLLNDRWAKIF